MSDPLTDLANLAAFVRGLPIEEAIKLDLLGRIERIGRGEPMAAGGSHYDRLADELAGPGGKYPAPKGTDR